MATDAPQVTVIICHHTGRLIERCLESVAHSRGVTWETLVLSSETPCTVLDHEGVRVICLAGGPAHKRNVGAQLARAATLVFLDDDVEVSPYTLYQLWRALVERQSAAMMFAKIYNMERRDEFDDCGSWLTPTGFLWSRAGNHQRDVGQFEIPDRCLAAKSATCAIRRSVFFDVGGFDARYYILGEETDLAWRCWLRGWECWYEPTVISWHAFGTSLKPRDQFYSLSRIHYLGSRNYLWCLLTNVGTWKLMRILPLHLFGWLASCAGFALQGEWPRIQLILKGLWDGLQPRGWWVKRQQVQSRRVVSDRQLWPSIACPPMIQIRFHPPLSYYLGRLRRYTMQGLHG